MWELYCSDNDEILLYAFVLIKRMLCNTYLPCLSDYDFPFEQAYNSGLSNFNIEIVEIDEHGYDTQLTISLPLYIFNHITTLIEMISDDYESEKHQGKVPFNFLAYISR